MNVEWIACTDREPPDGATCWVVVVWPDKSRGVNIATYLNRNWWQRDDDISRESVSHWAPYDEPELPPPD